VSLWISYDVRILCMSNNSQKYYCIRFLEDGLTHGHTLARHHFKFSFSLVFQEISRPIPPFEVHQSPSSSSYPLDHLFVSEMMKNFISFTFLSQKIFIFSLAILALGIIGAPDQSTSKPPKPMTCWITKTLRLSGLTVDCFESVIIY
jgi:hypothetical protein